MGEGVEYYYDESVMRFRYVMVNLNGSVKLNRLMTAVVSSESARNNEIEKNTNWLAFAG